MRRNRKREAHLAKRREECGGEYVQLSPAAVAPIFDRVTGIPRAGFREVRPGWWARAADTGTVDVLQFLRSTRGYSYRFRWGVSTPWVPRVSTRRLRWHRTVKSAVFDLWDQPHDYLITTRTPWKEADAYLLDHSLGAACFEEDLGVAWDRLKAPIEAWWNEARGAEGVLARANEQARRRWEGADHAPDPNLVAAFTLARLGDAAGAALRLQSAPEYREHPSLLVEGLQRVAAEAT